MPCSHNTLQLLSWTMIFSETCLFHFWRKEKKGILPANNTTLKSPQRTALLARMLFLHKLPSAVMHLYFKL